MHKPIADVHSLLLPLQGAQLLLPNAAVAEIIEYRAPEVAADQPDWSLGKVTWRGIEIPLVSFEAYVGQEVSSEAARLRIAVLNTLNGNAELPFIGVVLKGIPRLLTAGADSVAPDAAGDAAQGVLARVQAAGEGAMVPDIDALERSVAGLAAA